MGPLAGIGDALTWATLKPLFYSIGVTFAMQGSLIGAFIPLLFALVTYIIGYYVIHFGYKLGKESVALMLHNGIINKVITSTAILGLFMMGALSASYIKVETILKFKLANAKEPLVIQNILDSICPGLLPLIAVMGIYLYFRKKGQNYNMILIIILAVSLIGAFIGIF